MTRYIQLHNSISTKKGTIWEYDSMDNLYKIINPEFIKNAAKCLLSPVASIESIEKQSWWFKKLICNNGCEAHCN